MLNEKEITIVEEKKYYKKQIIEIIENIDRVDLLIYLYHFVKGKSGVSSSINKDLEN